MYQIFVVIVVIGFGFLISTFSFHIIMSLTMSMIWLNDPTTFFSSLDEDDQQYQNLNLVSNVQIIFSTLILPIIK